MHRSWILLIVALILGSLPTADAGSRLPPLQEAFKADWTTESAPARGSETATGTAVSPLDALGQLLGAGDEGILPPDEAFRFSAAVEDASLLSVRWLIADGYYLYRDKMRFTVNDAQGASLGAVSLPAGEIIEDEFFGRVEIYTQDTNITLPLARTDSGTRTITLEVQYQGCAEVGVCYPPITKMVSLRLPDDATGAHGARTRSAGAWGSKS